MSEKEQNDSWHKQYTQKHLDGAGSEGMGLKERIKYKIAAAIAAAIFIFTVWLIKRELKKALDSAQKEK